ncbi:MAG: ABC transporter permease, partial [Planctomycetota bacterium]
EILVTGNKGSRIDALLSSLYHVGRAPGRVSWDYYEKLRADGRVEQAIPLAVGDNYRGIPVVGTDSALFTDFHPLPGRSFECDGEVFAPGGGGMAIAGSRTGLKTGDRFVASHGAYEHDDFEFRVTGVARPTGTAHDRVIWIDIGDFLQLEGHEGMQREGEERKAVSAILVKTKSGSPLVIEPFIREINDGTEAQAIRPMRVVGELFALVGEAQRVLSWVSALVIVVAALSVMVALYNTMAERRREIAILRAVGATRLRVFATVVLEAALLCAGGALLGLLLGHGGAALLAPAVEMRTGVRLESVGFTPEELLIVLVAIVRRKPGTPQKHRTTEAHGRGARRDLLASP